MKKRALISCLLVASLTMPVPTTANANGVKYAAVGAKLGVGIFKGYLSSEKKAVPPSTLPTEKQSAILENTLSRYNEIQSQYYPYKLMGKFGSVGAEAGFGVYAVAAGGAVAAASTGPILLTLAGAAVVVGLDEGANFLQRKADAEAKAYLLEHKAEIFSAVGVQSFAELKEKGADARETVKASNAIMSDLRTRGKGDVREFAIDLTFDVLERNDAILFDAVDDLDRRTDAVEGGLEKLAETMKESHTALNARLDEHETLIKDVSAKVADLQTSVREVDEKVKVLGRDQTFVSDFVFSKMSAREKAEALKGDFMKERFQCTNAPPGCDTNLKEKLIARFEKEADLNDMVSTASGIIGQVNTAAQIAADLGIDVPPEVGKAIQFGNAAVNAFSSFASGNPIGAIASLTGLLGGRKDPAAERHAAMMGYLKEQFGIMNGKLDRILENQAAIMQAVVNLHTEMRKSFVEVNDKLDNLTYTVNNIDSNVKELIWHEWRPCNTVFQYAFRKNLDGTEEYLDVSTMRFRSIAAVRQVFANRRDSYLACIKQFSDSVGGLNAQQWFDNFLDVKFLRKDQQLENAASSQQEANDTRSALQRFEDDLFNPAAELSGKYFVDNSISNASALMLLSTPSPDLTTYRLQVDELKKDPFKCFDGNMRRRSLSVLLCNQPNQENVVAGNFLSRPLLADAAIDITNWILISSQISDLYDPLTSRIYTGVDELLERPPEASTGRDLINNSVLLVDFVIASYGEIYGPVPAHAAVDVLDRAATAPANDEGAALVQKAEKVIRLLKNNPFLAQNVAMIRLWRANQKARNRTFEQPPSEYVYRMGWRFTEDATVQKFFLLEPTFPGEQFTFVNDRPNLYIKVGNEIVEIPMPPPMEFSSGTLSYPSKYYDLLKQRDRLVDRLFDYDMIETYSKEEQAEIILTLTRGG